MNCTLCATPLKDGENEFFICSQSNASKKFAHFFCSCFFSGTRLKIPPFNLYCKERREVEICNMESISSDQYLDDCSLCFQPSDGSCGVQCCYKYFVFKPGIVNLFSILNVWQNCHLDTLAITINLNFKCIVEDMEKD